MHNIIIKPKNYINKIWRDTMVVAAPMEYDRLIKKVDAGKETWENY